MEFTWMKRVALVATLGACALQGTEANAQASLTAPDFTSTFTHPSLGAGATTSVEFTISNPHAEPLTGMAFTHSFIVSPGPITIASDAASTDCSGATLTAVNASDTVTFSGGAVPALGSCTVTVDVTAATPGSYTDTATSLTSANAQTATLSPGAFTVVANRPGFSKTISPDTVNYNGTATITYTVDNSLNAARVGYLDFTETLPAGILIASPSNATTTCISASSPDTTLTATPGGTVISLDANGSNFFAGFEVVDAGATCEVSVDIVGSALGTHILSSGELRADGSAVGVSSDTLTVTATDNAPIFSKDFTDDPAPAGSSATLDFTIQNRSRDHAATDLAFTDDLDAMLTGATFSSLLSNSCGGSVSGVGTGAVGLTGGSVVAGSTCVISVAVSIPAAATSGAKPNTTSTLTGTIDGLAVVSDAATANLQVAAAVAPSFSTEFIDDPVAAGGTVTLRYSITNNDPAQALTDAAFQNELTNILPWPLLATLPPVPNPPCGVGSSLAITSPGTDRHALSLTSGNIPAGGSCSFDVTLSIPAGVAGGTLLNTTGEMTALVGGNPVSGGTASDSLVINGGVNWSFGKSFTPSSVAAGSSFTAEYRIISDPSSTGDVINTAFTDDTSTLPAGSTFSSLINTCGGTASLLSGNTTLSFSSATIAPGTDCTLTAQINIPAGATSGSYNTNTSNLTGTASGLALSEAAPTTSVAVTSFDSSVFQKSFSPDTLFPGETTTLTYTLQNTDPVNAMTSVVFTDGLSTALTGLAAVGPATTNTCGGTLSGTTFLIFIGGTVPANGSCTIAVDVLVPAGAADGTYASTTSNFTATVDSVTQVIPQIMAEFSIASDPLVFSKSFLDDPVAPGGTVSLQLTLENTDTDAAASISFSDDLGAIVSGAVVDSVTANTCGGTPTGTGTGTLSLSGGSLTGGSSCSLTASVTIPGATSQGNYTISTSSVTATINGLAVEGAATSDTLTVGAFSTPLFTKSFDAQTAPGDTATLTFSITNTDASTTLTNLSFTDDLDAVLTGLTASSLPATPCGAGSGMSGTSSLAFSGGTLPPSGICTFDVEVLVPSAASAGTYPNTTSALFSSGAPIADAATASLEIVPPPAFSMAFGSSNISQGDTTSLVLTIDNSANTLTASALDVALTLPSGLILHTPSGAATTCTGGTLSAANGGSTVSYTGGSLSGSATCTLSVDVTSTVVASYPSTTGDLTSSLGNSGTATATLSVTAAPAPELSYAFSPDNIEQDQISTLTFQIDNSTSNFLFTPLDFSFAFPSGLEIAETPNISTTCSGISTTGPAGGTSFSATGGTLPPLSTCAISVDVTSETISVISTASGALSGWGGRVATGSATLTVVAATTGTLTIVQNADVDGTFSYASGTSALNFGINTSGGSGQFGPITLPAGTYELTQSRPDGSGNASLVCNDSDSTVDPEAGVINIVLGAREHIICTFVSVSSRQETVDAINEFLSRRADLILANEPSNGRRIDRLRRGYDTATRVSYSDGDLASLNPFNFDLTTIGSGNYSFATSLSAIDNSVAQAGLAFGEPSGEAWVENRRWDIWAEGVFQRFESGSASSGHFGMLSLGADYVLNDSTLVGAMLQIDDMDNSDSAAGSSTSGTGWMIGPYITKRLSDRLYFDGRIAYGMSRNKVSPLGTYSDSFDGERWLARAQLTGDFERGDWIVQPNASFSYFQEMQRAYTDSLSVAIPSQTVALGQFRFGPTVKGNFVAQNGLSYQPVFALDAIYNFGDTWGTTVTNPNAPDTQGWRGRLKAGVNLTTVGGATINLSGTYDGIGRDDYEAWGLVFDINIPINRLQAQ